MKLETSTKQRYAMMYNNISDHMRAEAISVLSADK